MDFKAAFSGKDGLLENWEQEIDTIISFLLLYTKDKNVRQLLEKLKDQNIKENTSITESKYKGIKVSIFT